VDEKALRAQLLADKSLAAEGQCEVLRSRVYLGWDYTKDDYAAIDECKPFPYHVRSDI
jgi:hypothetical protein